MEKNILAINEAIEILNRLKSQVANGSMFAWKLVCNAEKHLNAQIVEHFAE